jgi:hypothetical protein
MIMKLTSPSRAIAIALMGIWAPAGAAQSTEQVSVAVDVSGPIGPALSRNLQLPAFDEMGGSRQLTGVRLLSSVLTARHEFQVIYTGPFPSNEVIRVDAVTPYNFIFPGNLMFASDRVFADDASFGADGPITFDGVIQDNDTLPATDFPNAADFIGSGFITFPIEFESDLTFEVIRGNRSRWSIDADHIEITGTLQFRYTFTNLVCSPADFAAPFGTLDEADKLELVLRVGQQDAAADLNADGSVDFFDVVEGLRLIDEGCP